MLHCKITLVNAPKPAKLMVMGDAVLTISSKNYSSWSLRGWLLCRMAGLDFKEEVLSSDDPSARAELLMLAPSFLVPRLTRNGIKVWDTLAIAEYLHENFPQAGLLPADPAARTHCRSVSGEMHSGFANMRSALPMNLKAHYEGFKIWAAAQADIERIITIWRECLGTYGGPYLFGETPTMADAMYAPVATRFATYDVALDRQCSDYCETILALPDMIEWTEGAHAERAGIEELEAEF
jgi:glutathione S-transferase